MKTSQSLVLPRLTEEERQQKRRHTPLSSNQTAHVRLCQSGRKESTAVGKMDKVGGKGGE